MISPDPAGQFAGNVQIPFHRISSFVRQLSHDVRNGLNAIDLQAAYVAEICPDAESREELKRMRTQIQQSARALQAMSGNFWVSKPSFVTYSAAIFVEDFQDRLKKQYPEKAGLVAWNVSLKDEVISIDIEMIFSALSELFKNAFHFAEAGKKISASVFAENGRFVLELQEEKSELPEHPELWGCEPFVTTKRGGYGLGLFKARMILSVHSGDLEFSKETGRALLKSRISLPLAS